MTTSKLPAPRAGTAPAVGGLPDLRRHLVMERLAEAEPINWNTAVVTNHLSAEAAARRPAMLRGLNDALDVAPSLDTLRTLQDAAEQALGAKPDPKVTATALALLFDSRVRQPANPTTYLNVLVSDLIELRFPPAVVAAACQRLRRSATFVPEVGEVIETCRSIRDAYRAQLSLAGRAIEARERATAIRDEAERLAHAQAEEQPR